MAILIYILGIMTGIVLFAVAAHFGKKNPEAVQVIVDRGYPVPKDIVRWSEEKAEFLDPGDEATDAMEEVIEEHEKAGEHTKLEEIA